MTGELHRLAGTRTSRLNSATRTPSWFRTRVWAFDRAAVGFRFRRFDFQDLGLAEQGVAVEDRVRMAQFSVAGLAIALPETSLTDMPSASEPTSGPTTTFCPCCEPARTRR